MIAVRKCKRCKQMFDAEMGTREDTCDKCNPNKTGYHPKGRTSDKHNAVKKEIEEDVQLWGEIRALNYIDVAEITKAVSSLIIPEDKVNRFSMQPPKNARHKGYKKK